MVEIIGKAGARAARIRFQAAAQWKQRSRKLAVHIRPGMKEGISAVKLPLRSGLVLSCGEVVNVHRIAIIAGSIAKTRPGWLFD